MDTSTQPQPQGIPKQGNNSMLFVFIIFGTIVVIGATVFVYVTKKVSQTAQITQNQAVNNSTSSSNPFIYPTEAYQNPFGNSQTSSDAQYQNPFANLQ